MSGDIDLREVLLSCFPGIEPNQADEMIACGQVNTYPPGVTLCHEGTRESVFYIILSGKVKVTKRIGSDEERKLQYLGPGGFFGEMAIIHNAPRAANVTTMDTTTVLEIYKESFNGLLEHSKSVSLAIIREVSGRLRRNDEMAIEDLRLKAKELAEAYQQLAEEEFARSEFLTVIAHELRTPLTAANGYLQAVRAGMIQGDALPGALDTVWRNMQEITSLTNDILFLQEMELILPEFRPTDIHTVIRAAMEQERSLAERIDVRVSFEAGSSLPTIPGDPKSLQRALAAILDNAIKFSPDGGEVKISARVVDQEIYIIIQDHGVGIPPDAMHRIFQRFFHLDIICGRVFRGIGLGLSIAKHVIEQHQGTIDVQSELEKGSTFTVRLKV
jgi:signal transduction histidine kinase